MDSQVIQPLVGNNKFFIWVTLVINYFRLGLTPDEEIDYAYLTYNLGLDVFYLGNQIYTARQVVTK
jgi:hypothetical protein